MDYLVSIIVPVFKVEKYIVECVQSIIAQSYIKWELILVDDGSPDSCGDICDYYSNIDSRVKVIHKENGGLSDARNVALDIASGQLITFVDSDDYISSNYLQEMIECMVRHEADIIQCSFTRDKNNLNDWTRRDYETVLNEKDIFKAFLRFNGPTVFACGKLYKSEILHDIRYPKGIIDEDNFTTYKTLMRARVFVIINECLYYYRKNEDSITRRPFNKNKFDILGCIQQIRSDINDYEYTKDIDYYELRHLVQIYNNAVSAKVDVEYENELDGIKKRIDILYGNNLEIDMKYKILIFLLLKNEFVYKLIVRNVRSSS